MIFLSYSNADVTSALVIKSALEAGGVRCWKAPEDIRPGERWAAAITRAIRDSTAMVVVVSERSMTSPEVAKELALAMSRRLLIIPLRIEEAELSDEWAYHFATIQWIDAFGGRLEAVCARLVHDFGPVTDVLANPGGLTSLAPPAVPDPPQPPRVLPAPLRVSADAPDLSQTALPLPQAWWWEHMNAIDDATVEKGAAAGPDSRTGGHQRLWTEVTAWLAELSRIALGPERWDNKPNQFQIGKLSYTYWARIYPDDGRAFLGYDLHIGVQLAKNGAKWTTGIDADVGAAKSQAVMALWASTNDRGLARMVNEAAILETYGWVQQETLLSNPELHTGLVRDKRGRLMRAQTYLSELERGEAGSNPTGCTLWSPLISLDDVRNDPARVSLVVAEYLRILAEPVRVARAMVVPPTEDRAAPGRLSAREPAPTFEAHVQPEGHDVLRARQNVLETTGSEDDAQENVDVDEPDDADADADEPQPLYALSPALRVIVGATPLSSMEIITRVWAYIKYFGLQDAANMRIITPDALLAPVMDGNTTVMMSDMAGYLHKHMTQVSSA